MGLRTEIPVEADRWANWPIRAGCQSAGISAGMGWKLQLVDGDIVTEPFPSCLCRVNLQGVDGLGELAGTPGAAAELTENPPGLELCVRALAGGAEPRVVAVRFFLGFRLVLPPVRDLRVAASLVALIGQGDQARRLQLVQDAPDPLGFLVVFLLRAALRIPAGRRRAGKL